MDDRDNLNIENSGAAVPSTSVSAPESSQSSRGAPESSQSSHGAAAGSHSDNSVEDDANASSSTVNASSSTANANASSSTANASNSTANANASSSTANAASASASSTVYDSANQSDDEFVSVSASNYQNRSDDDSFHSVPDVDYIEEDQARVAVGIHAPALLLPPRVPSNANESSHDEYTDSSDDDDDDNDPVHHHQRDHDDYDSGDALGDEIPQRLDNNVQPGLIAVAAGENPGLAQMIQDYFEDDEISISDDSSSDEATEDGGSSRIITFDQSAPAAHRYLGGDMEDLHGRTLFDEDSIHILPAHIQPGVVLMPGQTMPMSLQDPNDIAMMRTVIENQKTLAMLHYQPTQGYPRRHLRKKAAGIGTTAEVLSVSNDSQDVDPRVRVITRGRQRFRLLGVTEQNHGIMSARIKILRERVFGDPLEGAIPPSHYRSRAKHKSVMKTNTEDTKTVSNLPKKRTRRHNQCCYFTHWPGWVYSQYSPTLLMYRLKEEIRKWGDRTYSIMNKITCPDQLAYWLADNIPMSDESKLQILCLQSGIQRLRYELHLIQKYRSLSCRHCNTLIAKRSDVFSLSIEGPMGTFVNPHGCVHETLTLRKAKHLTLRGRSQTEFSWYPGYAWTIVNCRTCGSHKGWRFTSDTLQPSLFYGLTRNGLILGIHHDPNNSDEIQEHLDMEYRPFVI